MRKIKVGDLVEIEKTWDTIGDGTGQSIFWSWYDSQPKEKVDKGLFLYVGEDKEATSNDEPTHKFVWVNDPHYYFTAIDEYEQNTWKWLQQEFRKQWGLTINTLN